MKLHTNTPEQLQEVGNALRAHLGDCVDFDGLGYDGPKENTLQCAAYTLWTETIEHDRRAGNLAAKFTGALQGLPSYIYAPFYNGEICDLIYALGLEFDRNNDDECDAVCELYWTLCGTILKEAAHEYLKQQPQEP